MLRSNYPSPPLSAIPAVLLAAFKEERFVDSDGYAEESDNDLSDVGRQRAYATYRGASERVRECGEGRGHDVQAAALLMAISDLDVVTGGGYRLGGEKTFRREMDPGELRDLERLRETLVWLLTWHFENGAGALLPIASWLGVVEKEKRT